jgi:hypothetical protein
MRNFLQRLYIRLLGKNRISDYISPKALLEPSSDEEKQNQIEKEIEGLIVRAKEFSSNKEFWTKLLALIEQVRLVVVERRWIPAQQSLTEAILLANRAIGSEALRLVRIGLVFIPLVWFVLFYSLQRLLEELGEPESLFSMISHEYFQYIWLGMLGGTTMVFWGIVKHSTEMDFDPTYIIWYLLKPALGAIMGVTVVLVVQAVFILLQGNLKINNTEPLLALALLGGFGERFFIRLIDRVITTILGGEKIPQPQAILRQSLTFPTQEISGEFGEKDKNRTK